MMISHSGPSTTLIKKYATLNPNAKLDILMSYGNWGKHNSSLLFEDRSLVNGLICDSGTWTLNQNPEKYKRSITFRGYAAFLQTFSNQFDFYFNFDADFSKEGSATNLYYQKQLESKGLCPVPVIHDCYSSTEVNYYIDNGYKLIAIGSGELKYSSVLKLRRIVDIFYDKGIKVHFLGCTDFVKLASTPVYSCDSSSWGQKAPRGFILFWNPKKKSFNKTDEVDFNANQYGRPFYKDYPFYWDLEQYLQQELGFSCQDLEGTKGRINRKLATLHYFVKLEQEIAKEHKRQGFTW